MGILSRDKFVSPISLHYSISGMEKKRLIIGLGNIGKEYELTRHNIGFDVVDTIAEENGVGWSVKKDLKSEIASTVIDGKDVILAKPTTFMNNSGEAVRAVMDFYKIAPGDTLIVHDELDLDFGDVRFKKGGSSAGHNGIKSVIQHLGEDFARIRIGIGPKVPEQIDSADFVLQKFSAAEQKRLSEITKESIKLVKEFLQ